MSTQAEDFPDDPTLPTDSLIGGAIFRAGFEWAGEFDNLCANIWGYGIRRNDIHWNLAG